MQLFVARIGDQPGYTDSACFSGFIAAYCSIIDVLSSPSQFHIIMYSWNLCSRVATDSQTQAFCINFGLPPLLSQ